MANRAPVVTVSNTTLTHAQTVQGVAASSLFSATDPDGDTIASYTFYDTGNGGGHLSLGGVAQATGTMLTYTASQLQSLTYVPGSATDTLYVKASDGTLSSDFAGFTVTPGPDNAPVVMTSNYSVAHNGGGPYLSTVAYASDPDGDQIVSYNVYDAGTGGGHLSLNGVTQAAGVILTYTFAQFQNQLNYIRGPAMDTIYVSASDGALSGSFASLTISAPANQAPVVATTNAVPPHNAYAVHVYTLFTASDGDSDPLTYSVYDAGTGGGHLEVSGVAQASGVVLTFNDTQYNGLSYVLGTGTDTLYVSVSDGTTSTGYVSRTVSPGPESAPIVSVSPRTLTHAQNQTRVAITSLVSASDPDGDAITSYNFYDAGAGGGHLLLNGNVQATGVVLTYTASQLSQLTYVTGGAVDTMYVSASDGTLSSAYSSFTITPGPNAAPTVTVSNKVLTTHAQTINGVSGSNLVSASDPDGDAVASYNFYNVGAGGGHFLFNGAVQTSGTVLTCTAAQLSQLYYQPGSATDTLYASASDGLATSAYSPFTVTPGPNTPPTVSVSNRTLTHAQTINGVSAYTLVSATDPDGDVVVYYTFYDVGTGGGHLVLNGVTQASGTAIEVNTGQTLTYQPGTTADTLYVRASDGDIYGAFGSFTVTPGPNNAPAVAVSNKTLTHTQTVSGVAASSLVLGSDTDGDAIKIYTFYDVGAGGGHLSLNGVAQASGALLDYTPSQLSQLTYQPGSAADMLYARVSDGAAASAFGSFTVTPGQDQAPTVTAANKSQAHGTSVQASSLFTTSDPDGDAIQSYAFYDTGTGGAHFSLGGTSEPTGAIFSITAGQLAGLTYIAGTGSPDTIYVRASDGPQQSAFTQFAVSPT